MSGQARRIEMFSDGVFAIAITLLVLELPFGKVAEGDLARALGDQDNATAAAVIYSGAWIVATAALSLLWRHALKTGTATGPGARRLATYYWGTLAAYVVFAAVALVSPIAMVVLYACTGVVFLWRGDYTVLGSEPAD